MREDTQTGASSRERYQTELERQLDAGTAEMLQLQEKAAAADARARTGYYAILDEVREKRESLLRRLEGLRQVGPRVWLEMKPGADHANAEFQAACARASKLVTQQVDDREGGSA